MEIFSDFILKCLLKRTLREDDLTGGLNSTVGQIISLFLKNKKYLVPKDRSITRYKTFNELWEKAKSVDIREKRPREINDETHFIVDSYYKVLIPLTEESSKFWGRGTRWRTASENISNNFNDYSSESPLYVVILPNGRKYQFWSHERRHVAVDQKGTELSKNVIENNWKYFKTLKDIISLRDYPERLKTYEMCKEAVIKDHNDFAYIPKK